VTRVLAVDDIHTYYGESYVLHGVSLEVPVGRLVALMGRNGVGKTTLVRSITGLTPPQRGSIAFDGADLTKLRPHEIARRGIGLVPQGRRVFGSLSVQEHLEKVGYSRTGAWSVERVLDVFPRLHERWREKASHLSGGEQSMLAIARALRLETRCLLMDEPMEGLSPVYVQTVVEVIEQLRAQGDLSILLVVPELAVALRLADHVCVMSTGQIVFQGTPAELESRKDVQARYIGIGE
jgi:branched-chain amino acid transport system ATP-binding protein